jgi:hypothetical protein
VEGTRLSSFSASSIVNGLSVHGAQFDTVNYTGAEANIIPLKQEDK